VVPSSVGQPVSATRRHGAAPAVSTPSTTAATGTSTSSTEPETSAAAERRPGRVLTPGGLDGLTGSRRR
jgi:hypothetical protein